VEPAGANQSPAQQVDLAAGESVGALQRLARSGARGEQHRHPAGGLPEDLGELRAHMATPGGGDHESVHPMVEERADMAAVVREGDGDETDARVPRGLGREGWDVPEARAEADPALADPADRTPDGRAERGRAAGVQL